jgi:hypothetical protein
MVQEANHHFTAFRDRADPVDNNAPLAFKERLEVCTWRMQIPWKITPYLPLQVRKRHTTRKTSRTVDS